MANVRYTLSKRAPVNGRVEVLVRFYCAKGCDYKCRTGIFVPADKWDDFSQNLAFNARFATPYTNELLSLNNELNRLKSHLLSVYLKEPYKANSTEWLKSCVSSFFHPELSVQDKHLISELCYSYADSADIAPSTANQYRVIARMLERYSSIRGELSCEDITHEDIDGFVEFLRLENVTNRYGNEQVVARGQNTISSKLKRLRAACNHAVRLGYIIRNPLDGYKIPQEQYGTPIFLTIKERDAVADLWISDYALSVQRDIFIFQCHVGCRVGDLYALTRDNIDGAFLVYVQQKLKRQRRTIRVPLDDTAMAIVQAYASEERSALFPFIAETHYNDAIRKVLQMAGITRSVMVLNTLTGEYESKPIYQTASSHLARRTFAANMFKATKSERITAAFTGHSEGSRAFGRYTEVDDEMKIAVLKEMEKPTKSRPD